MAAKATGSKSKTKSTTSKGSYIDAFFIPLPKKNLAVYQSMSKKAGKVWMEHGALEYRETIGDDLKAQMGIPFPALGKTKPSETVVFSWIVYKSKAHRDSVNKKVMADPRMNEMLTDGQKMPFDVNRMSFGGFKIIVNL